MIVLLSFLFPKSVEDAAKHEAMIIGIQSRVCQFLNTNVNGLGVAFIPLLVLSLLAPASAFLKSNLGPQGEALRISTALEGYQAQRNTKRKDFELLLLDVIHNF